MRTFCRFGSKRRLVATIEWLRLFPNAGPLPQLWHTLAIRGSLAARKLGPQLRHPEHGLGRLATLVALVAARARERLLHRLARENPERARHAGVELHAHHPARGLPADEVVVVGLAPDHRAEAGNSGEAPPAGRV